jgi:hypothetical protein
MKTRPAFRTIVLGLFVLWLSPGVAHAQTTDTASIQGKVTDESGAVMPGVTVTIASPALQTPQVTSVTDVQGAYHFSALPGGTYSVKYELSGFQSITRTDVRIAAGFAATLDTKMALGTLEETITVSGASPVVDVRHPSVTTSVSQDLISTLPTSRDIEEIAKLAPGSRVTGTPDVGGNRIGNARGTVSNYGSTAGGQTPMVDGINTDGTGGYFDAGSFQEVQIRSGGSDAEFPTAGMTFNGIVKSGGNQFHGEGLYQWETAKLQSSNIDADLRARGVTGNNPIDRYFDLNANIGGRIVRDRLWFFASGRSQQYRAQLAGFAGGPGADGVYFTADDDPGFQTDTLSNGTAKVSGQLTSNQKLAGFYSYNRKYTPDRQGSVFVPHEAAGEYTFPTYIAKGEWTWTPSSRSLVNAFAGRSHWTSLEVPYTDNPTTFDIATQRWTGAVVNSVGQDVTPAGSNSSRWQYNASYSYFIPKWVGEHQLKTGIEFTREFYDKYEIARGPGTGGTGNDFQQQLNNGLPFQVLLYNNPFVSHNNVHNQSVYVRDDWRLGNRLTIGAGLRWERYHAYLPAQTKPVGTWSAYFPATDYPYQDLYDWKAFAPRVGVSYALTADNKTALKASYGRFNSVLRASDSVTIRTFNKNDYSALLYRWNDTNGDKVFQPTELGAFVNAQGGSSTIFNPDIQQPVVNEVTLQLQRELMSNFSVRAGYVFKNVPRQFQLVNLARPYSTYDQPIQRIDPGPDGRVGTADDGGPLTYYDVNPAYAGAAFFQSTYVNTPGFTDHYSNFEISADKRMSNGWQLLASYLATKRDVWIGSGNAAGVPLTPNDEFFPKDETWDKTVRLTGSYLAKWGIETAAVYEYQSGLALARTVVFAGATSGLKQLSTLTLRMEPIGATRLPGISLLNLRVGKQIRLGKSSRLSLTADLFNTLNTNVPTGESVQSGPSYGTISTIVNPRIGRLGVTYAF